MKISLLLVLVAALVAVENAQAAENAQPQPQPQAPQGGDQPNDRPQQSQDEDVDGAPSESSEEQSEGSEESGEEEPPLTRDSFKEKVKDMLDRITQEEAKDVEAVRDIIHPLTGDLDETEAMEGLNAAAEAMGKLDEGSRAFFRKTERKIEHLLRSLFKGAEGLEENLWCRQTVEFNEQNPALGKDDEVEFRKGLAGAVTNDLSCFAWLMSMGEHLKPEVDRVETQEEAVRLVHTFATEMRIFKNNVHQFMKAAEEAYYKLIGVEDVDDAEEEEYKRLETLLKRILKSQR